METRKKEAEENMTLWRKSREKRIEQFEKGIKESLLTIKKFEPRLREA